MQAITETFELNRIYGNIVDITSGRLNRLWHDSTEQSKIPDYEDIKRERTDLGVSKVHISDNDTVSLDDGVCLDFGAVAKGYALDCLYDIYSRHQTDYAVVSFGSSILLYSARDDKKFDVAVKSDSDSIAGTVSVGPCFVSTSGDYERYTQIDGKKYHHILDLSTGYPSDTGLSSVTVFSDQGLKSDFLSTMIFIDGVSQLNKYLSSPDFDVIATDKEGKIYVSKRLTLKKIQT